MVARRQLPINLEWKNTPGKKNTCNSTSRAPTPTQAPIFPSSDHSIITGVQYAPTPGQAATFLQNNTVTQQRNIRGHLHRKPFSFRIIVQHASTVGEAATFLDKNTRKNATVVPYAPTCRQAVNSPPLSQSLLRRWHLLLNRRSHRCLASPNATTTATTTTCAFPDGGPDAIHHALQLQREACSVLPRANPAEPGGVEQATLNANVLTTVSTRSADHSREAVSLKGGGWRRQWRGGRGSAHKIDSAQLNYRGGTSIQEIM